MSVGSALFTVISIYGFIGLAGGEPSAAVDPTRVAAQIVSGIGFLGAGAIIKYGTSVRGLTTAGSLWATAAIGMAAGTGQLILAVTGWAIVLFSLWPLNWLSDRLALGSDDTIRLRLRLRGLEPLAAVTSEITALRAEISEVRSEHAGKGRYDVELDVRPQAGTSADGLIPHLSAIADVESVEATSA